MTSPTPPSSIMEGMQSLGTNIDLYTPPTPSTPTITSTSSSEPTSPPPPTLIILCTWLGGATPRRIQKYIDVHRTLFPSTPILLLRTTIGEMAYHTTSQIHTRLLPACDAITSILSSSSSTSPPSILAHIFSNGGAKVLHHLCTLLPTLPLHGLILDCAPGTANFSRLYLATAYSLPPSWLAQRVGRALIYPFLGTLLAVQESGLRMSIAELRRGLNDEKVVGAGVRRLYLYGMDDEIILPEEVESHAEEARRKGYDVSVVGLVGGHCGLVRNARYRGVLGKWWFGKGEGREEEGKEVGWVKSKL